MKMLLLLFLFGSLLFSCRNLVQDDEIKSFIPGMYVTSINGEFGKGTDTLILASFNEESNSCQITRKTSLHRILNDKILPVESKEEMYTGIYDEENKVLNDSRKGKVFTFDPAKGTLSMGGTKYRKLN
jgi:hypothetical protein